MSSQSNSSMMEHVSRMKQSTTQQLVETEAQIASLTTEIEELRGSISAVLEMTGTETKPRESQPTYSFLTKDDDNQSSTQMNFLTIPDTNDEHYRCETRSSEASTYSNCSTSRSLEHEKVDVLQPPKHSRSNDIDQRLRSACRFVDVLTVRLAHKEPNLSAECETVCGGTRNTKTATNPANEAAMFAYALNRY